MLRFLALALPLAVLLLAAASFAVKAAGLEPDIEPLVLLGVARPAGPAPALAIAALVFQALALVAAVALLAGRSSHLWLDGLAAGLVAWLFRGPLLVLTIEAWTRLPERTFRQIARNDLLTYPLVAVAIALAVRREPATPER